MSTQQLALYNTLSRSKEIVTPIRDNTIHMYSCGPTVYSTQHIGNMRAAFIVDLLRRVLHSVCGYSVKHVMNITDVGHLTGDNEGDANQGEDRMEKGARKEGLSARDVAKKYTMIYEQDLVSLNINATTEITQRNDNNFLLTRATDHISEQIEMIEQLEKKGHVYIIPGDGVYMDTATMNDYGTLLSQDHLKGIEEGSRVASVGKRNPTDFALRKFNVTGKKRDMERPSPRGVGFPGRHIECSAMSIKYLGEQFDIHTGGMEHIPVHHTNEIAQAECCSGKKPRVNLRVHYQWLMMNNKKIAKSTGNVAYISDILEQGFSGEDMRFFYLQAHYRSFHDFTRESLQAAAKSRQSIIKKISQFYRNNGISVIIDQNKISDSNPYYKKFCETITDDLATPAIISDIFEQLNKGVNLELAEAILLFDRFILSCGIYEAVISSLSNEQVTVPDEIVTLSKERIDAKIAKDFTKADQLRDRAIELGRRIVDTSDGVSYEKIV